MNSRRYTIVLAKIVMFRDEYKQGLSLDVSLKVIQFKTESLLKEEGN